MTAFLHTQAGDAAAKTRLRRGLPRLDLAIALTADPPRALTSDIGELEPQSTMIADVAAVDATSLTLRDVVFLGPVPPFRYAVLYDPADGAVLGYWDNGRTERLETDDSFTLKFPREALVFDR